MIPPAVTNQYVKLIERSNITVTTNQHVLEFIDGVHFNCLASFWDPKPTLPISVCVATLIWRQRPCSNYMDTT